VLDRGFKAAQMRTDRGQAVSQAKLR
jgi:hypothetical protein